MDNLDMYQTVIALNKMSKEDFKEFYKSVEGEQVFSNIFNSQYYSDFAQRQEELAKSVEVKPKFIDKFNELKKAYSEPMASFSVDVSKDSAASSSSSIDAC